jgi:SAM-dependent methyltransferase
VIPRVFHRVWLGGKPMPEPFARWGEGWLSKHPGWTMKLWTEPEAAWLTNADLLPRCGSLAQRADIVRYEALHREGGVYLDTDMECLRNIEPLIEGARLFACWQRRGFISNAVFGGVPGNEAFEDLFRRSRTEFRTEPWNAMGPPFFTTSILASPDARIFDRRTFIPYTRAEYERFPRHPMEITDPPPESYAINHRSSVWHSDSMKLFPGTGSLDEARRVIDGALYWHYAFRLPWTTTVPTKPGWGERVEKRRGHFFRALLDGHGGTLAGKNVLDLGCCQGYWSFESRRAGAASVLGIDSSEAFVREAEAVRAVLGVDGCSFARFHLEDDPWWTQVGRREVTLFLGTLYHLTDPVHALRRAMAVTTETLVVDGEVVPERSPSFHLRPRTPGEPTTARSGATSGLRAVPTVAAIVALLRDGGFRSVDVLEPGPAMPPDYLAGTTASVIARR